MTGKLDGLRAMREAKAKHRPVPVRDNPLLPPSAETVKAEAKKAKKKGKTVVKVKATPRKKKGRPPIGDGIAFTSASHPVAHHMVRRGRPRLEDAGSTLAAIRPWEGLGMSRRTWFRREAEKRSQKAS